MTHGEKKRREVKKEGMSQRLGQRPNVNLCVRLNMFPHSSKPPIKRWHGNFLPLNNTSLSDSLLMTRMRQKWGAYHPGPVKKSQYSFHLVLFLKVPISRNPKTPGKTLRGGHIETRDSGLKTPGCVNLPWADSSPSCCLNAPAQKIPSENCQVVPSHVVEPCENTANNSCGFTLTLGCLLHRNG